MNIRKLTIFYETAKSLNMSKVAKEMYVSQPSVSQCISEIELELNTKLFDRIGKRLYLTHDGEIFYSYVRRILNIYDEAINEVSHLSDNKRGKIIIGASSTIGTYIMPEAIKLFTDVNKNVDISLIIDIKSNIESMVLNNEVDIGFIEGEESSKELIVNDIWKDEIVFISSLDHNWTNKDYLEIDDIRNNRFIVREKGSSIREIFEIFCRSKHIKFDDIMELTDTEAIINSVRVDLGVSCISHIVAKQKEEVKKISISRLKNIKIERNLCMVIHKDKYKTPEMESFIKFCNELNWHE